MIKSAEIQQKARAFGVRDQQIEKDYILSWILTGISQHKDLSKWIAFKGGTVLKKIYFEDYRFSEDLDFTLLIRELKNEQLFKWFNESFEYVKEATNISLEINDFTEHINDGFNFYISYQGPLGGQSTKKSVKVDISREEQLLFQPILKDAFLGYSDLIGHQLLCYTLEEVILEKMRSIMQRMQARDFYDLWYILDQHGMNIDFYLSEFKAKCSIKQINPIDFKKKLMERLPQYKARWNHSLSSQIKNLPSFEKVEREVQRHLKNLIKNLGEH
ncbi:MAG: nucleotidyl transferase AbiEii/AbiGii toxin family protein [Bacteroidetes bacterium]|nr:nucleotidyl transferase AbiEii/AbiGii toxin family protein [Bacteroidota bacterium]